jgi:hypothetical protein
VFLIMGSRRAAVNTHGEVSKRPWGEWQFQSSAVNQSQHRPISPISRQTGRTGLQNAGAGSLTCGNGPIFAHYFTLGDRRPGT